MTGWDGSPVCLAATGWDGTGQHELGVNPELIPSPVGNSWSVDQATCNLIMDNVVHDAIIGRILGCF